MKTKLVKRYYCEFCKKSGCNKSAMEKHEKHCTMNPNRECRMCVLVNGGKPDPMNEMLALLPDPRKFLVIVKDTDLWTHNEYDKETYPGLDEAVEEGIKKLRELTDGCPACMLAAIRQAGLYKISYVPFDYKRESEEFFKQYNEDQSAAYRC